VKVVHEVLRVRPLDPTFTSHGNRDGDGLPATAPGPLGLQSLIPTTRMAGAIGA